MKQLIVFGLCTFISLTVFAKDLTLQCKGTAQNYFVSITDQNIYLTPDQVKPATSIWKISDHSVDTYIADHIRGVNEGNFRTIDQISLRLDKDLTGRLSFLNYNVSIDYTQVIKEENLHCKLISSL